MKKTKMNKTKILPIALTSATALGTFSLPSDAALIVFADPSTQVIASTELPTTNPNFTRFDDHIVDGSGLLTTTTHDNGADDQAWLSTGTSFGGLDTDPYVIFDLGDTYTINSFRVWNYNENATGIQMTRGVNAVTVEYGTTLAGPSSKSRLDEGFFRIFG